MTDVTSRKSDPELAGSFCGFATASEVPCPQYARYAVSYDAGNGQAADPEGVCGQHLGEACRSVWTRRKKAAVVQEIPGAWRPSKDNRMVRP